MIKFLWWQKGPKWLAEKSREWKNPPETFKGYRFKNPQLFQQALTHKGYKKGSNNQRLEFLGDAVLSLAMGDSLMRFHPQANEGFLTKKRSSLVSGEALAELAKEIQLHKSLRTGNKTDSKNPRLLADAFEACLGAVYLDGGFQKAKEVIEDIFAEKLKQDIDSSDYKSAFQEWCQKTYQINPTYRLKNAEGPEHKKTFLIELLLPLGSGERILTEGRNIKKKLAEQIAAKKAIQKLNIPFP